MTYNDEDLIKKVKQIQDHKIKDAILKILNGETVPQTYSISDVDNLKREIQNNTATYIMGIKFVTTETADQVLKSIKEDVRITPLSRFVKRDNLLKLQLSNSNLQPVVYYFLNKKTYAEVLEKLPSLGIPIDYI